MPSPALQNFVDKSGPVLSAAWLNNLDQLSYTVFDRTVTKVAARVALTSDAPLELTNGGTGVRSLSALSSSLAPSIETTLLASATFKTGILTWLHYDTTAAETAYAGVNVNFSVVDNGYPVYDPRRYGVDNTGATDTTVKFQAYLSFLAQLGASTGKTATVPPGLYKVSSVVFGLGATGVTYSCHGVQIIGLASGTYSAVVEIMASYCDVVGLTVNANYNANYECAIHWYTNNSSTTPVNYDRFERLYATQAVLGICIGMLPSQASAYYGTQGQPGTDAGPLVTPAKPTAINAPVSESYFHGLRTTYCVVGVRVQQPNGKVTFSDCDISGDNTGWGGLGSSTVALAVLWGEVIVKGGSLEQNKSSTGLYVSVGSVPGTAPNNPAVTLDLDGVVMESIAPFFIQGEAVVRLRGICDWGQQGTIPFFWIHTNSIGQLVMSDGFLLRANGSAITQPMIKGVSDTSGTFGVVNNFDVLCSQMEFRSPNFLTGGGTYEPICQGVRSWYDNCWFTIYDGTNARTQRYRLHMGTNGLVGKVDLAGGNITAYGVNAGATVAGWTFTVPGGTPSWGRTTTGLPSIVGLAVAQILRMHPGVAETVLADTAKFPVIPGQLALIKGYIKTTATAGQMKFTAKFYDFSGAASATPSSDAFVGAESQFGTTWQPFELWVLVPADACQMLLEIDAENSTDVQVLPATLGVWQ